MAMRGGSGKLLKSQVKDNIHTKIYKCLKADGVTTPSEPRGGEALTNLRSKKIGQTKVTHNLSKNMLPQFYQTHLQQQLTRVQFLVLGLLLNVLQSSKQVKLDWSYLN